MIMESVSDPALNAFLDDKQAGGNWQIFQTLAPVNVSVSVPWWLPVATTVGDHTVWLSWEEDHYGSGTGGFDVFVSPVGAGAWVLAGSTMSKGFDYFPVTGLDPDTSYDFSVRTFSDPFWGNKNTVQSETSEVVMTTTATVGCQAPSIETTWGDPITLSLSENYDSYYWMLGEETSSTEVSPSEATWYWVSVTSPGGCEEAAAALVDPAALVFLDGFESGDTASWSSSIGGP